MGEVIKPETPKKRKSKISTYRADGKVVRDKNEKNSYVGLAGKIKNNI